MIKILKQKTTWAGISIVATAVLPLLGVPTEIVAGILTAIGGLAVIFLRQAVAKSKNGQTK